MGMEETGMSDGLWSGERGGGKGERQLQNRISVKDALPIRRWARKRCSRGL